MVMKQWELNIYSVVLVMTVIKKKLQGCETEIYRLGREDSL